MRAVNQVGQGEVGRPFDDEQDTTFVGRRIASVAQHVHMFAIAAPNNRLIVLTFHFVDGYVLCHTDLHVGIGSSVLGIALVHLQGLGCAVNQQIFDSPTRRSRKQGG